MRATGFSSRTPKTMSAMQVGSGWTCHPRPCPCLPRDGGPTEYHNVLARTRRALRPGGSVLVSKLPYPASLAEYRANPVYKALTGVLLHEAQVGCGAITQGELRALLAGAGYANVRRAKQPLPARFVMLGEK